MICPFSVMENITIISRYINAVCHFTKARMKSMACWNAPGAFLSLNGIRINRYNRWWELKAVLSFSLSLASSCQYPPLATFAEKRVDYPREPMHSFIHCTEYKSFRVTISAFCSRHRIVCFCSFSGRIKLVQLFQNCQV